MSNSNLLHGLRNVFPAEEILTGRYLRIDSDASTSPSVEWLLTSKLGFLQLPIVRTVPPWDVGAALLFLATIFSEGLSFVSVGVLGELRKHQNMAQKQAGSVFFLRQALPMLVKIWEVRNTSDPNRWLDGFFQTCPHCMAIYFCLMTRFSPRFYHQRVTFLPPRPLAEVKGSWHVVPRWIPPLRGRWTISLLWWVGRENPLNEIPKWYKKIYWVKGSHTPVIFKSHHRPFPGVSFLSRHRTTGDGWSQQCLRTGRR